MYPPQIYMLFYMYSFVYISKIGTHPNPCALNFLENRPEHAVPIIGMVFVSHRKLIWTLIRP